MDLSDQKYEELIHLVYAVLDQPDGWETFCTTLSAALDATMTQVLAMDRDHHAISLSISGGSADAATRIAAELAYIKHRADTDARWSLVMREDVVDWVQCHKAFSEEYVAQSKLYQETLLPINSRYISAYKLLYDAQVCVVFTVHTSQSRQPLGQIELDFLNRLMPHLTRVVKLQRHIYQYSTGALVGCALINKLHQPIILLNLEGGVVHKNGAADELLRLTQILHLKHKKLIFPEPYHQQLKENCAELEKLFRTGQLSTSEQAVDVCMKIVDSTTQEFMYTFSSLMIPERSMGMFGTRPLLMLTLYHPNYSSTVDMQLLTTIFKLTPAECRVTLLLMQGYSIKEIAYKNQVQQDTVRTQMKAIFLKTGTSRQSDLLKLLSNLPRQSLPLDALLETHIKSSVRVEYGH